MIGVGHIRFDSRVLPPGERMEGFEDFVTGRSRSLLRGYKGVDIQSLGEDNPNYVKIERWSGQGVAVSSTDSSGYVMNCNPGQLPTTAMISVLDHGEMDFRTKKNTLTFKEGDILINAATTSYQISAGPSKARRIVLPLGSQEDLPQGSDGFILLPKSNPIAEIVKTTIDRMAIELCGDTGFVKPVSRIANEILASILQEERNASCPDHYSLLRARVRFFIEENIASKELNAASIAEHVHTSRATLYRAFEQFGGVREYINDVRLDMARKQLSSQIPHRGHVVGIAYSCGFSSPSSFGRAFKRRFGISPGAFVQKTVFAGHDGNANTTVSDTTPVG